MSSIKSKNKFVKIKGQLMEKKCGTIYCVLYINNKKDFTYAYEKGSLTKQR